jgi:hypothetical protein
MAKKIVKVDVSNINDSVELESVEDVFEEPIEPVRVESKSNIYKDALETVLTMIKSGTHVENIMKYIDAVLK